MSGKEADMHGIGGHEVPDNTMEQLLNILRGDKNKDHSVNQWLSLQLLRQEFQLTFKNLDQGFKEMKLQLKELGRDFVGREEYTARKEADDKEHQRLQEEINKKADADTIVLRLERLERIMWLATSTGTGAIMLALLNLVIKS